MASISNVITFIPTIGDNHSKPDSERFSVKLKAVNIAKKQGEIRKFVDADPKKLMKEMMSDNQQNAVRMMLNEHFLRFENFTFKGEASQDDVEKKVVIKGMDGNEVELTAVGQEYERPMTMKDIFDLGEFELAMEIFMHLIGSSQLRKPVTKPDEELTVTQEREDEGKNSESPSGTTPIH